MFYEIIYERKAHLIYVQKNKHSFFSANNFSAISEEWCLVKIISGEEQYLAKNDAWLK